MSQAHLLLEWRISIPPTSEFHASAQFLVLMLPHFFSSLFNYTRHSHSFMSSSSGSWKRFPGPGLTDGLETRDRNRYAEVTQRPKRCQETARVVGRVTLFDKLRTNPTDGICGYGVVLTVGTKRHILS